MPTSLPCSPEIFHRSRWLDLGVPTPGICHLNIIHPTQLHSLYSYHRTLEAKELAKIEEYLDILKDLKASSCRKVMIKAKVPPEIERFTLS
ncbi:hypothetical protein TWF751_003051 [Orbilia oligospora]|nr:hypothetical protein TWF751_003051 [Orbilia oligospora]